MLLDGLPPYVVCGVGFCKVEVVVVVVVLVSSVPDVGIYLTIRFRPSGVRQRQSPSRPIDRGKQA